MTLVKFNRKPFVNNLVDDLFTDWPALFANDFNKTGSRGLVPVNVKETEKSYQLEVVAPGFEKTDFRIDLENDLLTISAEKKTDADSNGQKDENKKMIRHEYNYSSFKRSFTIDEKTDATKIEATYVNGVLVLNLPKKEEVKEPVKSISIK